MIDLVCGNLELLQLHEYAERVKDRTQELVKHSDDMIELNRLAMSIRNWIDACSSLSETTKVKTLDGYIKTADEYKNQLQDIKKRIVNIKQIDETKQVLDSFKKKCEKLKGDHKKRVSDIYKRIREIIGYNGIENISQEIEKISQELDVLFSIFEGTIDEEDLLDNKHIATSFAKDIKLLSNLQLSKYEFENCYNNLRKKCIELFGERETQWPIEELYGNIYNAISSLREEEGKRWLDGLNDQISELDSMSKEDLRIILSLLDSFPPFLEDEQTQKAHEIKRKIESHLNKLDLEWLIEHFKELSPDIKKDFYIKIQSIMNNYIDSDWLFDCFKKLPPDIQKEFCIRIQTE